MIENPMYLATPPEPQPQEQWQFMAKDSPLNEKFGPMFAGARRNSRGPWLTGEQVPQDVRWFLNLQKHGENWYLFDFVGQPTSNMRALTTVRWQRCNEAAKGVFNFPKPVSPITPDRSLDIDLKWSLWSRDESIFRENGAGDALEEMRLAFSGGGPEVWVRTAPRKEVRYGDVTVSKHTAKVYFRTLWDTPEELANGDEGLAEAFYQYFCDELGFENESPIGAIVECTVKSRSFAQLLNKIDALEYALIEQDKQQAEHCRNSLQSI